MCEVTTTLSRYSVVTCCMVWMACAQDDYRLYYHTDVVMCKFTHHSLHAVWLGSHVHKQRYVFVTCRL